MKILHTLNISPTHDLVAVITNGRAGGNWYRPMLLRLVTITAGTEYTRINAPNVAEVQAEMKFNGNSQAQRKEAETKAMLFIQNEKRQLELKAEKIAEFEASQKRPLTGDEDLMSGSWTEAGIKLRAEMLAVEFRKLMEIIETHQAQQQAAD